MQQHLKLLTDEQIIQFITQGYLVLNNELPNELHLKVMSRIHEVLQEEGNPGNNILPRVPDIQKFFDTPVVKGALTGILGPDYYLHPHRHCHYNQPANQNPGGGNWHKDGYWSAMRSHRPWWAMIFYYTQAITEELGPTAIMPGSQYNEAYPGDDKPFMLPTGPAGTMVLVHFDLWHKASLNTSNMDRYMLKFQFARLSAPTAPSWDHQKEAFQLPDGMSEARLPVWQSIWDWMRGQAEPEGTDQSIDIERLASLAQSQNEDAALNSAYALARAGAEGISKLHAIISTGTYEAAKRATYAILTAGEQAINGLIDLLEHEDGEKRSLACSAIGMIGAPTDEALRELIQSLSDENESVRRHAAEALGMIAEPSEQAVAALTRTLEEAVAKEREERAGHPETDQSYIRNKIGYAAALSLLRVGRYGNVSEVISALNKALDSSDRYVRAYAFEALTFLRTEEAVDVLLRYYRSARWCPDTNKASTF
ncbi:HEAT repeat domain-containing protein [Bacillus sp. FJAT-26390]|uniref:HEAT repeat domain-containing protein n=1 Tax=Bacillus sp. FJAT-26390 TaxID=1743142 RepID=UPI000807BC0F|nr:HEAT repeat domain-containing protein [Bacillus sp. FJAT-26390]OBZ17560.1 phytanoyl-CoA dioxygenase [Bacillus sp. FJAT-26390]